MELVPFEFHSRACAASAGTQASAPISQFIMQIGNVIIGFLAFWCRAVQ
jgi:hypothetical protein